MSAPNKRRTHSLNEDFFERLIPQSAYVFGYWVADGYMHHDRHYKVCFSSKDRLHLEAVKRAMGSNTNLYQEKRNSIRGKHFELNTYSKKLFMDLQKLGGFSRKSTTILFPAIPDNLLPDYLRGYFDGDGSVHEIKYKKRKNGKVYSCSEIRSNFTCGSIKYIYKLRDLLTQRLGLSLKAIGQYGPHQFKLGYGQKDTLRLLRYMYYPNHCLSLDRKAKYLKFFL